MATRKNTESSVQFSINELFQIEEKRRIDEEAQAKAQAEEQARQRLLEEERQRRMVVEAEVRRAAEKAAAEARLEAEEMLAQERAKIAHEQPQVVLTPVAPRGRPVGAWMGLASMILAVLGLVVMLGYILTRDTPASVRVTEQPISIFTQEVGPDGEAPVLASENPGVDEPKRCSSGQVLRSGKCVSVSKPQACPAGQVMRSGKCVVKPVTSKCDPHKDPLCGIDDGGLGD